METPEALPNRKCYKWFVIYTYVYRSEIKILLNSLFSDDTLNYQYNVIVIYAVGWLRSPAVCKARLIAESATSFQSAWYILSLLQTAYAVLG